MRGTCHASFAYDLGLSIDLDHAERLTGQQTAREEMRRAHRSPAYFAYKPTPLRISHQAPAIQLAGFETAARVDSVLFDFGAVSVSYEIPFDCELADLVRLSEDLYENQQLLEDSRRRVDALVQQLAPAVRGPGVVALVEDYVVYHVRALAAPEGIDSWIQAHASELAQVLRSDGGDLSREEVEDAMACRASYRGDDVALIDWGASFLRLDDAADVRAVLEFANVELLEMRFLDDRLDSALDRSYEALARPGWWRGFALAGARSELSRLGRLQADAAILFEGVDSALKLVGDQYLARVYRLAARRFHLPEWDATILRKLSALESIYQKVSDRQSARRMEALEWIIIALIAVSLALPLFGLAH